VGPRACLDDVEKRKFLTLPGLKLRPLGRPARSQSLYPLRHEGVWGSGCIDPHFLDLGNSWGYAVSFTPRPL
jgi:hypothetical protein